MAWVKHRFVWFSLPSLSGLKAGKQSLESPLIVWHGRSKYWKCPFGSPSSLNLPPPPHACVLNVLRKGLAKIIPGVHSSYNYTYSNIVPESAQREYLPSFQNRSDCNGVHERNLGRGKGRKEIPGHGSAIMTNYGRLHGKLLGVLKINKDHHFFLVLYGS